MNQMRRHRADGRGARGQRQLTISLQKIAGALGELPVRALHAAQGESEAGEQNARAHRERDGKFQRQIPVQFGVLAGNAAAVHQKLDHPGQLLLILRAQRHFHEQ